jgi:dipeptidyl-peptidase 4
MKNILLFFVVLSFGFLGSAQQKLDLEKSVLGQYREFYPKHNFGFAWIPGTSEYTVLDGFTSLLRGKIHASEREKIITIQELNGLLGSRLGYFQGFEWKDSESFFVNDDKNFYSYNVRTKEAKTFKLGDDAENADLHVASGNIAFTVGNNLFTLCGGKRCQITNFKDENIVSGQAIARREMGITKGTFWSPNGNFLAFYQKDETNVADYPLLDITKTPGALRSIKYPMAGQPSERAKVGVFNTKNKKVIYISPRSGVESYLTNVAWSPDEKFVLIAEVNRDQKHMWLQLYDVTGKFIRTLFEEKSNTWVEPEHPAFFVSNTEFLWVSERDGFNNLYAYNVSGEYLGQKTANKFMLKQVLIKDENGNVFFSATGESPLNTVIYKLDESGKQTLITWDNGTYNAIVHPTGKYIYSTFNNLESPNREEILAEDGKVIQVLLEAGNPYAETTIGKTTLGTIKAKDGTDLYTRLIQPSNFDPSKKYPVLVYVYGGPHAQMITNSWLGGASLWMHWMAEQGYLVFTVDNRGSAERGVAFEHAVHRNLGDLEIEDQLQGVEYLKSLPYVDSKRLAVHGWSYGGFMATSLMLRTPGVFTTGVAGGPVTDWKYYEIMYGERYMDRPEQNREGYRKAALTNYVSDLQGKLLLIHGTIDDVVVMQHNLVLVQEFIKKGKQVDFFPYPMHEHNVRGKDRVHLMEKILTYVLENNK